MEHQTMIVGQIPWSKSNSSESPYAELAAEIVGQAIKDYIKILRKLWKPGTGRETKRKLMLEKADIEDFFYSHWCYALSDIDPDKLLSQCRIRAKELEREAIERKNELLVKKMKAENETKMKNAVTQEGGDYNV